MTRVEQRPIHWFVCFAILILVSRGTYAAEPVQFNRDVRPILAEYCFPCHGFDQAKRAAGLRLDDRAIATKPIENGSVAIVPGDPKASELIVRLTTDDESLQMPPPSVRKRPTSAEISTLTRWIADGAEYQSHWAFVPLTKPAVPLIDSADHPIDAFVVSRLRSQGRDLSPRADRDTLIRRVYFDLIGLPPNREQLEAARRSSWNDLVDSLLASPHFGERMAVDWLDAARYADTDGYFGDKPRQMWLWRDWVIKAFNDNVQFDCFTIEQLAGDLLPNATTAQRIATGFNRNHMSNDETGLVDEEYRVEYVADRVDTTMSTWLGLTVGCAQCHDHKFDPISQREYYQLFAYFNNVPETGLLLGSNAPPRISVPTPEQEQEVARLAQQRAEAQAIFEPLRKQATVELAQSEHDLLASLATIPHPAGSLHLTLTETLDPGSRAVGTALKTVPGIAGNAFRFDGTQHIEHTLTEFPVDGPWTLGIWIMCENSLAAPLSKVESNENRRGIELLWQKGRIGLNLTHMWGQSGLGISAKPRLSVNTWHHVVVRYDGSQRAQGVTLFVDGMPVGYEVLRNDLSGTISTTEPLRIGRRDEGLGYYGSLDELRWIPARLTDSEIADWFRSERIRGILERESDKRSGRDVEWLLNDHIAHRADATTREAWRTATIAHDAEKRARDAIPTALVMEEMTPTRVTHILERGVYNKPQDVVQPGLPSVLSLDSSEYPPTRLGLARWLVDPRHPLTARVAVNRLWRQCFGEGLVRTMNDFGTQGESPTHPELLDWLAATFRDSWNTKALLKLIVTSRTYQQQSRYLFDGNEPFDPENRLFARGPSFRLSLEMLRDQALVAGQLFVPDVGGPSVKPFQPAGLWEEVSYNAEAVYEVDTGPGRYRRSLYTFHKRQAPPPALLIFDGPTREKCTLKRPRTNTPLQALVLLNDATWIEAARALAASLQEATTTDADRIAEVMHCILGREATKTEEHDIAELLKKARAHFRSNLVDAAQIADRDGAQAEDRSTEVERTELAAWTIVVHTLFNLDEAITRR